jgi:hypothetical protein
VGALPFKYLGLPVGGDHRREGLWKPVVDAVRNRLSKWNNRHLSIGGIIVLLKSVLYALPVYFLSFFKAPSGIISKLESLFKRFLWGGGVESRKINWVKWDKICREKEDGGLGIKNLKAFNLALLGKWKWRIQSEKNSLWVRVLASKYGESNGRINRDGSQGSAWWKDINNIERGVWGFKLDWFSEKLSRHLGNGSDTLFWLDP